MALVSALTLAGCLVGERPVLPDADGDNLPDEAERAGWLVRIYTQAAVCGAPPDQERPFVERHVTSNVVINDNDTDGLTDDLEFLFRTDPNDNDTDDDGLSDRVEFETRYSHPTLYDRQGYSGSDVDSDGDCLTDPQELEGFDVPGFGRVATDPTTSDTDLDGWSDYEEAFVRRTNPADDDSDGDGARDNVDVDPLRDIAFTFSPTAVRVIDHPSGRSESWVGFTGTAHSTQFVSAQRHVVPEGAWTDLPDGLEPGYVDPDDFIGEPFFYIQLWFTEYDASGQVGNHYDFNPVSQPSLTSWLRVYPANHTVSIYREGSVVTGSYTPEGHVCQVEGKDGGFRFDLRIGRAGTDPSAFTRVCA